MICWWWHGPRGNPDCGPYVTCFAVVESFSQLCSRHSENSTGGTERASLRLPPFVITQEDDYAVIGINTFCDCRWKQGGPVEIFTVFT